MKVESVHPGGVPGRHHRRHQPPPRHDHGHGEQEQDDQRARRSAALGNVRLRQRHPLPVQGPRRPTPWSRRTSSRCPTQIVAQITEQKKAQITHFYGRKPTHPHPPQGIRLPAARPRRDRDRRDRQAHRRPSSPARSRCRPASRASPSTARRTSTKSRWTSSRCAPTSACSTSSSPPPRPWMSSRSSTCPPASTSPSRSNL